MRDAKSRSIWKWLLVAALKLYAGLCTLLVTACLAFLLWAWIAPEKHQQTTATGEEQRTGLDLTGVALGYHLPAVPSSGEALFHSYAGTDTVKSATLSNGSPASASQADRSETNQTSSTAGSGP